MRRLRPGVDSDFAVDNVGRQAVDIVNRNAVVAPLPGFSTVGARVNRAKESTGEYRAGSFLEDDRADILAAQRALRFTPFAAVFALEANEPVLGAHPKLP